MIRLYLEAPFAVFRTFTAGWYRPSARFLTPSAAYGLLMNVAGVETRLREEDSDHGGKVAASLMRHDLPSMRLAIAATVNESGEAKYPIVQSTYQQLHNYPVGSSSGTPAALAKGNKNNITPVRREVLSDLRAVVAIDADVVLEKAIIDGLAGRLNTNRYGLPFLGDNNFLPSRFEQDASPREAYWYQRIDEGEGSPHPHTTRLTIWIDRADSSQTTSALFRPTDQPSVEPPEKAWIEVGPSFQPSTSL